MDFPHSLQILPELPEIKKNHIFGMSFSRILLYDILPNYCKNINIGYDSVYQEELDLPNQQYKR